MKIKRYLLFILLFILLSFLIPKIYSININIIGNINEFSYTEVVNIGINCNEELNLNIPKKAYNIYLNNFSINNTYLSIKNCSKNYSLKYNLNLVKSINNPEIRIERTFNNYRKLNFSYSIKIPIEYSLIENKSFPSNYTIKYTNKYKIFKFNKSRLYLLYFKKSEDESNNISINNIFDEVGDFNVILMLFFSFLFGLSIMYIFMIYKLKKLPKTIVSSYVLSKEERLILDTIKENLGINQKQIANKINYSKSRVSSIINQLEDKTLIRREKFGRSFKVYINKKIV